MGNKVLKIVLDIVLSIVVLVVSTGILAWVSSLVFGTTKGVDGQDYTNVNSLVLLAITFAITVVFAVWFYGFLDKRGKKAEE